MSSIELVSGLNAVPPKEYEAVTFQLPARRFGARWKLELSTADPHADERSFAARDPVEVDSRSLVVLRRGW